jgi:CheY-like chemotaxis protein
MVEQPTAVRGLVVDDDPDVIALLTTLLRRRGIVAESAGDGGEAAALLRANEYDLAFIDLGLPHVSGERLLRDIEGGSLKRPVSVALISAAANLANVSHGTWARNVTLLSKPFASSDVASFIDRAFGAAEREAAPRPIVLGGSGLWCQAATLVATRRGGRCITAPTAQRIGELCETDRPLAVVLGPPIDPLEILQIVSQVKEGPGGSDIAVFVAMMGEDAERTADLLTLGVDRVVSIAGGVLGLSEELLRVANLTRRVHRRVPLATKVLLHAEQAIHLGQTFDVGEGGIGVEMSEDRPQVRTVIAEFTLPGDDSPISAHSEVAWVDPRSPAKGRLGLRFTDVIGAERIRSYVASL